MLIGAIRHRNWPVRIICLIFDRIVLCLHPIYELLSVDAFILGFAWNSIDWLVGRF
jgi:hypothetical protein